MVKQHTIPRYGGVFFFFGRVWIRGVVKNMSKCGKYTPPLSTPTYFLVTCRKRFRYFYIPFRKTVSVSWFMHACIKKKKKYRKCFSQQNCIIFVLFTNVFFKASPFSDGFPKNLLCARTCKTAKISLKTVTIL